VGDLGKLETATLGFVIDGLMSLRSVCGFVGVDMDDDEISDDDVIDALKRLMQRGSVEMYFWDTTKGDYVPHSFEMAGDEALFYFVGTKKGREEYRENCQRWFPEDE
jgi:hypothetical protein